MHAIERAIFKEPDQSKTEAKSPGLTPSKIGNYQKIAAKSDRIIGRLFELLESRNDNTALGAANKLIDKILPDLRATELTGEDQGPIKIIIVTDNGAGNPIANPELSQTAVDLRQPGPVQDSGQGSEVRTDQG